MKHMSKDEMAIRFFIARFGLDRIEKNPDYLGEWIERFRSGEPEAYMDSDSRKIFESMW